MKIRNIAIGIAVVGVIFAGGVAAVAWQNRSTHYLILSPTER